MQTEGRDIGSAADELDEKLKSDPSTRSIRFDWVGQVALMKNTFSGLGLAIGLAIMVVFMIMASQFEITPAAIHHAIYYTGSVSWN